MKIMKHLFLGCILAMLPAIATFGQVSVNTDGSAPDNSAMLDVKSTSKGMLIPRMNAVEKGNIASPVTGLLVYQTDVSPGFFYYDGSAWVKLTSSSSSGIPAPASPVANNLLTYDGSNWVAKNLVLALTGQSQPISIRDPYLVLNYCIAMQGIFPSMNSANPFLGEIQLFAFNFAPNGWAMCNGQLLAINQNQALFALLGTQYGGNGVITFALPDLRGRTPIHQGQGPGLPNHVIGESAGTETITILPSQLPAHTHAISYQ